MPSLAKRPPTRETASEDQWPLGMGARLRIRASQRDGRSKSKSWLPARELLQKQKSPGKDRPRLDQWVADCRPSLGLNGALAARR